MGVLHESSKIGECREVTVEKHRYNGYLPLLGKGLKLIERSEIAVYVTERESAKGLILRNRPVSDAVHTVYILTIKKNVVLPHFPGMVLSDHAHPFAFTWGGRTTSVDLAPMKQSIAAVEFFSNYHALLHKSMRIRVLVVAPANRR